MIGNANGRPVIDKVRARKDAAKVLAVNLQARYRVFLETANDQEANTLATGALAQCMYENIEFVIWALKNVAGMNPPPPEKLHKITPAPDPRFTKPPELVIEEEKPLELPCTCPPLEHGIIGRDRHMTSCPKFKP